MTCALLVVAAGSGSRLGLAADLPKALVQVAGRSLLEHTLQRLRPVADHLVVVHPPGFEAAFAAACPPDDELRLVPGGSTRSASVRAGVAAATADLVAIHDAARPFMPLAVLGAAVAAVEQGALAAAPTLPVADTLKRVEDGRVVATVDRRGLHGVQTPQVFPTQALRRILTWAAEREATDELGLAEAAIEARVVSGTIAAVPGSPLGFKITYPDDLLFADLVASAEPRHG